MSLSVSPIARIIDRCGAFVAPSVVSQLRCLPLARTRRGFVDVRSAGLVADFVAGLVAGLGLIVVMAVNILRQ
jgi:hypothetical protein